MNVTEDNKVVINSDDGDCENKTVKKSSSKNLN